MDARQKSVITTIDSALLYPVFVVLLIYIFNIVLAHVNHEYIDEIFHVSQCQKYCQNVFDDWNPKITTPPGLYFMGYLYTQMIKLVDPVNSCGLSQLRSLNYLGGVWVLPMVLKFTHYPAFQFPISNLISFPLLTVYYCLFYTDVWSTILVIFSLVIGVSGFYNLSLLLGLISITFRQTNVIWNAFILVFILDRQIRDKYMGSISKDIQLFIKTLISNWRALLPFMINLSLFAVFLFKNKGITFGDKENHIPGIHVVQLFYCAMFICAFSVPIWISPAFGKQYLRSNFSSVMRFMQFAVSCGLIIVVIDRYTITHPFLLADNRHYIFYIWKRIIDRSKYSRYMLAPVYHFSIYTIINLMKRSNHTRELYSFSWISSLALIGCIGITIIPSPLFEPRYYIVPYLFWRINVQPVSEPVIPYGVFTKYNEFIRLLGEFIYFNVINAAVFYVFINYTFEWPNEPGIIQRIIW